MAWHDKYGIMQKRKTVKNPGLFLFVISQIVVWIGIIPIFILDVGLSLYHSICFSIYDVPRIPRKEYIVIDRGKLKGLNWYQKIECMYCGYANGVAARFKAIANITELYSCAIKHKTKVRGQEHQKDFYEYKEFLK